MVKKYAELTLYYGLCNNENCGEGIFRNSAEKPSKERYFRAMSIVNKNLSLVDAFGFHISPDYLVQSEAEAQMLITFSEKNIPQAYGLIELVSSLHGKISFFRKIIFEGAAESHREDLIGKLKESGFEPLNKKLEYDRRTLKDTLTPELLEERLKGIEDLPWEKALNFYQ